MSSIRDRKNGRQQITQQAVLNALASLRAKLDYRLEQYGLGTYASRHEVLGIINEEIKELTDAVHGSPLSEDPQHMTIKPKYHTEYLTNSNTVRAELLDIAVAAIFSVACIDEDGLAW